MFAGELCHFNLKEKSMLPNQIAVKTRPFRMLMNSLLDPVGFESADPGDSAFAT